MSKSITQDMTYRQSLMKYAEKFGLGRASRKYNKSRSYIYFWQARWDGRVESLACQSRRPHHHPRQHTEEELKLIRDMRRRNPKLGLIEFWSRLHQRGYSRRPESLYRVMRKLGMFPAKKAEKAYQPKRFYSCHSFYSLENFAIQLSVHNRRSNNLPTRPLHWLSPAAFAVQYY